MQSPPDNEHEFVVDELDDGGRVDVVLAKRVSWLSRRRAAWSVSEGLIRVNSKRVAKGYRLVLGERVVLATAPTRVKAFADNDAVPLASRIKVVFAHDALFIVSKPALVPCQPLRAEDSFSLIQQLAASYPEVATIGSDPREGGLLHRIDVGTSGLVAVARSDVAFATFRHLFVGGTVRKGYLALVRRRDDDASIEELAEREDLNYPLARARTRAQRGRMLVITEDMKAKVRGPALACLTHYQTLARSGDYALLAAFISRGRMHQIRAHLSQRGYPIVGDDLYGLADAELKHQALHATTLEFELEGEVVKLRAPLYEDMRQRAVACGFDPEFVARLHERL